MGNARFNAKDWAAHASSVRAKPQAEIFTGRAMNAALDPAKIKFRESVASEANPHPTPIILAADETGSMGILATEIIKDGLGVVMDSIYTHKPVADPQICCMGVGDAFVDSAPLQVTEFEASVAPLTKQVQDIYIEGAGGGNGGESYSLPWWFASFKVKSAAADEGRKGYLFTIGDECPHDRITPDQIRTFLGVGAETDVMTTDLLEVVQKHWHVFHLIVKPHTGQNPLQEWRALLNERAIPVRDHTKLSQVIVTTISIVERTDTAAVMNDFDGDTKAVVGDAVKLLTAGV